MSQPDVSQAKAYQRYAWIVLFLIGILLVVSGLYVTVAGTDEAEFENSTGLAWSELSATYPEVAEYITRLIKFLGYGFLGFAVFSVAVVWVGYRRAERWAWYTMWILPAVTGATAVTGLASGSELGYYYGGMAVISLIALVLPFRLFFAAEPS